uniref:Integrase catalytic domain-containing protein n=1 Tax=Caenorhabditis japonica TaxID=281687 RepID=A0A8R1EGN5_CAEJA
MTIPRQVVTNYSNSTLRLIVFSDASQDIMGACVYTHFSFNEGEPVVNLFCAKNKIKPAKSESWTIPILELTAIGIGSNLAAKVIKEIRIPVVEICFMTDSAISLFWLLKKNITRPLVANRVKAYYENKDFLAEKNVEVSIRHCPTKENSADIATRGMNTTELQKSTLWFHGPDFLKKEREEWPSKIEGAVENVKEFHDKVFEDIVETETPKPKQKKTPRPQKRVETVLTVSQKDTSVAPFHRTKSLRKLVSYMHRVFLVIQKSLPNYHWETYVMKEFAQSNPDQLTHRRKMARTLIIQQHYEDSERLGYTFPPDLNKYIGEDGLYRIKRQVKSSVLPQEAHEPILIHSKHILAELIVRETHELNGHLPETYTISALRTKYHIQGDRRIAKRVISSCTKCKKVIGKAFAYPNSQVLPSLRTEPSVPFQHAGIDYLGPVPYIKDDGREGKALVLVYTCLVTRGARLELVPDATTERYIESLGIVFSRSGIPKVMYSDNATTFQLGEKLLNEDIAGEEPSESLTSFLADREIEFLKITPLSPWQGGVYERIVGLVKHQLQKELGRTILDFQSLRRVLAATEAMINSRPLTPFKKGNDMVTIRPIDFLLPGALLEAPESSKPYDPRQSKAEKRTRAHMRKLEEVFRRIWKFWSLGLNHVKKKYSNRRLQEPRRLAIQSRPIPPTPAIFDIPKAQYMPKEFLDSEEPDGSPEAFPSAAELPIVGELDVDEEEIDYDAQDIETEETEGEYRDPNMTPEQRLEYSNRGLPERRTREYLPRKAKERKVPYVNYVHAAVVTYLSSSRPPECCQFNAHMNELANLKAI